MASGDQDGRKYTYISALYLLGGNVIISIYLFQTKCGFNSTVFLTFLYFSENFIHSSAENYFTLQKVQKILPYALKSENKYLLIVYGGCFHSLILKRVP